MAKRAAHDRKFRVAILRKVILLPGKMFVLPFVFHYLTLKPDWWCQLRDIFRIHPDTACNTHDLLECPCDGNTVVMNSQPDPVGFVNNDDPATKSGFIYASDVRPHELDAHDKVVSYFGDQNMRHPL